MDVAACTGTVVRMTWIGHARALAKTAEAVAVVGSTAVQLGRPAFFTDAPWAASASIGLLVAGFTFDLLLGFAARKERALEELHADLSDVLEKALMRVHDVTNIPLRNLHANLFIEQGGGLAPPLRYSVPDVNKNPRSGLQLSMGQGVVGLAWAANDDVALCVRDWLEELRVNHTKDEELLALSEEVRQGFSPKELRLQHSKDIIAVAASPVRHPTQQFVWGVLVVDVRGTDKVRECDRYAKALCGKDVLRALSVLADALSDFWGDLAGRPDRLLPEPLRRGQSR